MIIKKAVVTNESEILAVQEKAFGEKKGYEIRQLVADLLEDRTAVPRFSFVAVADGVIVGHILFSKVILAGDKGLSAQILAPLAVLPDYQNKGVGSKLVQTGIEELRKTGVKLVFVLGHPGFYPRFGFTPAGKLGYEAPYVIPEEHSGAWMVQGLCPGVIGGKRGKVQCSDALNKPEHWRE